MDIKFDPFDPNQKDLAESMVKYNRAKAQLQKTYNEYLENLKKQGTKS